MNVLTATVRHARPGDGPSTLLLHGLGNSASVWDRLVRGDSAGLDLWTAELPWGGSTPSWAYQPDATRAIADALDQLPGQDRIVVAHSYATVLLLELLSDELAAGGDPLARHGIGGLVLVAPFYRADPAHFEYADVERLVTGFRRTMDDGIRVLAGDRLDAGLRQDMAQHVCERVGPYGYFSFLRSYLRTPWLGTDLIAAPALVVGGEADTVARPAEAVALAADLRHARCHIVAGAGHFPMVERPDQFAAILGDFAGSLDQSTDMTGARAR